MRKRASVVAFLTLKTLSRQPRVPRTLLPQPFRRPGGLSRAFAPRSEKLQHLEAWSHPVRLLFFVGRKFVSLREFLGILENTDLNVKDTTLRLSTLPAQNYLENPYITA